MTNFAIKGLLLAGVILAAGAGVAVATDGEGNYPNSYRVSFFSAYADSSLKEGDLLLGAIRWIEQSRSGEFLSQTTLVLYPGSKPGDYKVKWLESSGQNDPPENTDCFVTLAVYGGTYDSSFAEAKYLTKVGEKLSRHQAFTLLDKVAGKLGLGVPDQWGADLGRYLNGLIDGGTPDSRAVTYSRC